MRRLSTWLVPAITVFAALAFAPSARGQAAAHPERGQVPIEKFTARAVQMQTGMSGVVDVNVSRWSTDEERQKLLDLLAESGQPAAMAALQKLPQTGFVRLPNRLGAGLFYARSNELPDGGRQVVLVTARSIGMATRAPQASQYDATVIEFHLDKDGRGTGKIVLAGRASVGKDGKVAISNWQGEPVRLTDVRVVPLTK